MLKINTAKIKITPEGDYFPCYLCGHAIRTEKAKGILNDIYVTCIVLKINAERLIWCSFDLAGLSKEDSERMIATISKKYSIPKENINLSFVHTHSGPEFDEKSPFAGKERGAVPGYMDFIEQQLYNVVDEAINGDSTAVKAWFNVTKIDGFYGNRNGLDRLSDKDITTIVFKDEKDVAIAGICNFSCHPTVLGPQNLYISADLAGFLADALSEKWGCNFLIMQGAAGDMSNRQYRQGYDQKELERTGNGIMAQLTSNSTMEPLEIENVKVLTYTYRKTFQTSLEKKQQQLKDTEMRVANAKNFDEKKVYTSALAFASLEVENFQPTYTLELHCSYYVLGELSMFTMPAELFSKFGIEIKKAMNNKCNIFWGYSNYSVGYLYGKENAGESFESIVSDIPAGVTEEIISEIKEFINQNQPGAA